jgi:hypothetical protein
MVKFALAAIVAAIVFPSGVALADASPSPVPPGGGNFINSCVSKPNDLVGSVSKLNFGSCNPTPSPGG